MGSVYGRLLPTVLAIAAYFCLADVLLIGQCLYYRWLKPRRGEHLGLASASDNADQPLLHRKDSDIGLPRSRRQSPASEATRNLDFAGATLPAFQKDERNSKNWVWSIISILSVSLVGAIGWTLAWKAGFW